jgi:hypothetical protein
MANSKVTLLRYVRSARGWRRVRLAATRRGRGWDERLDAPEGIEILEKGPFQLRWYHGSHAVYKGVGHDLQEAITARDNHIANLEAERAATAAGRALVPEQRASKQVHGRVDQTRNFFPAQHRWQPAPILRVRQEIAELMTLKRLDEEEPQCRHLVDHATQC